MKKVYEIEVDPDVVILSGTNIKVALEDGFHCRSRINVREVPDSGKLLEEAKELLGNLSQSHFIQMSSGWEGLSISEFLTKLKGAGL